VLIFCLTGISKESFGGMRLLEMGPFCVGYRHESPNLFLKCKQLENFFSHCLFRKQCCDYFCIDSCIFYTEEFLSTPKFNKQSNCPETEPKSSRL